VSAPPPPAEGDPVGRLLEVIDRLRGEGGCPWDREQTLQSLKPYLIEEAYELLEAVDRGDPEHHREELGDVLLQILLHARIRKEEGAFTFNDVAAGLVEKLIRRHPHVFGETEARDSEEVLRNWEAIKAVETPKAGRRSVLDGVPRHLPALQKAQRVQSRASRVGFDWSEAEAAFAKVTEETDEVRHAIAAGEAEEIREEIGDLLFAVTNLCRFYSVNAEDALHATVAKFARRFHAIEERVHAAGKELGDCSLAEMDAIWNEVKRSEQPS